MNRKVYIKTYGCQMNERDSESVACFLKENAYEIVESEELADIVLMNTCSVRENAENKVIGKLGRLLRRKRLNQNFVLGILGCMAENRGYSLAKQFPKLDLIISPKRLNMISKCLDLIISGEKKQIVCLNEEETKCSHKPFLLSDLMKKFDDSQNTEFDDSQNTEFDDSKFDIYKFQKLQKVCSFVPIMNGCSMKCTYCIVPKTRGVEYSRQFEKIIDEIHELAKNGTREITLLGQIVNKYGLNFESAKNHALKSGEKHTLESGENHTLESGQNFTKYLEKDEKCTQFVKLLRKINDISGIERIRLMSPHPTWFSEDLIRSYAELPKLCPFVHLPIQSASDRILRAMKRPYTFRKYIQIIEKLRKFVPDIAFSTDIIVGFPGETDEDFKKTEEFLKLVDFDMAFVFKYSPRKGTPAEKMPDIIDESVKEERNQRLLQILEANSLKKHTNLIGTTQNVLIESQAKRGENKWMGRTPHNRKIIVDSNMNLKGQFVSVLIEQATVATLSGKII